MLDVPNQLGTLPQVRASQVAPSRLALTFSCDGDGRTYLDRQFASYPFHVCRPHYFPHDAPGMATLYVQSSAGGLYQEDAHDIEIVAKDDAVRARKIDVFENAKGMSDGLEWGDRSETVLVYDNQFTGFDVSYVARRDDVERTRFRGDNPRIS